MLILIWVEVKSKGRWEGWERGGEKERETYLIGYPKVNFQISNRTS